MNKDLFRFGGIVLLAMGTQSVYSQTVQKIGDNPLTLERTAVLELESKTKGFLTPRMTTVDRDKIVSPAIGLIVYNTTTNRLEVWNGTIWYNTVSAIATDATTTAKGIVQLAGDLGGTAASPTVKVASESEAGKVQLATALETTTGTSNAKAVHPAGLKVELDKKVSVSGNTTMTGLLTLSADPTTNLGAATKQYVDTKISSSVPDATTTAKGIVQLAGDLGGTAASPTVKVASESEAGKVQLATATETTTGTSNTKAVHPAGLKVELDKKVSVSGNTTMTGLLTLSADPTTNLGAATKQYVDTKISSGVPDATTTAKGIVQLAGDLDGSATSPTVKSASETAAGKVQLATAAETTTGTDNAKAVHPKGLKVELDKKLSLSGGTMTGAVLMGNNSIRNAYQVDLNYQMRLFRSEADRINYFSFYTGSDGNFRIWGSNTNVGDALLINEATGKTTLLKAAIGKGTDDVAPTVGQVATAADTDGNIVWRTPAAAPVDASTTVKGIVQLATAAETTTGTNNTKAVQPAGLKVELDKKLNLAGGTMSGELNMGGKRITSIDQLEIQDKTAANTSKFHFFKRDGKFKIWNAAIRNTDELIIDEVTGTTALTSAAITKGTDNVAPIAGQVATAADKDGNIVWRTPAAAVSVLKKVSANYTAANTDEVVVCTGNMTLTLPAVASNSGKKMNIVKADQDTTLTFNTAIAYAGGGTFTTINFPKSVTIMSDGTTWTLVDWN
ncbi:hypothetical protein [Flavobacterium poyangense]|uniref:hypothetical protein n=1 Tax=Flavobacterium poyangense TaxID=2204302 RepID=UPI0014235A12|nr:hypothetical protein [Flavobacterium sp. JXAS1]